MDGLTDGRADGHLPLFSLALTVEVILVEIVLFQRGWVTFSANFRGKGWSSTNKFWRQNGLSLKCCFRDPIRLAVLIQYRRVTHRQTHRWHYWKVLVPTRRLRWWEVGVTIVWMWWILWTILRGGGTKILYIHRGQYLWGLNGGGQGLPVLACININNLIPLTAGLGLRASPNSMWGSEPPTWGEADPTSIFTLYARSEVARSKRRQTIATISKEHGVSGPRTSHDDKRHGK